jgi:hypothetical protein
MATLSNQTESDVSALTSRRLICPSDGRRHEDERLIVFMRTPLHLRSAR